MIKQTYEILLCEKCEREMTNLNGKKCSCGNWLYYFSMIKIPVISKQLHDKEIQELKSINKDNIKIIEGLNNKITELERIR